MKKTVLILSILFAYAVSVFAQENQNSRVKEIIIVMKTHFDIGYTDYASEVVKSYNTQMIPLALETYEKNKNLPESEQFVWTIAGWPMTQIMNNALDAKQKNLIDDAFRNQRFVIHALPFTMETEAMETEEFVRSFEFSSKLSRQFGLPLPIDGKMTDVPSHTWGLVTMLYHAGIKFMHIGCNGGSPYTSVPPLFWWEGPDGSRVLTMYSKDYGTELIPPSDWPYSTYLAMVMTSDNAGPPKPEAVKNMLDEIHQKMPGVKVKIGRLSDFYEGIVKEEGAKIPVLKKDMGDQWIYGFMTTPVETKIQRNKRRDIFSLESLNTLMNIWGLQTEDISAGIGKAYEECALYGEHTFGMDTKNKKYLGKQIFGKEWEEKKNNGELRTIEKSWEEKAAHTYQMEQFITPNIETELTRLALNVKADGKKIVVYNSLPWLRNGMVSISYKQIPSAISLKDAETNEIIPAYIKNNTLEFFASKVPSMGYKTYVVLTQKPEVIPAGKIDMEKHIIETPYFKITLSPSTASVVSVIDKKSKKELVDQKSKFGLGQYVWEQFSNDDAVSFTRSYTRYYEWLKTGDANKFDWIYYDFSKYPVPDSVKHKFIVSQNATIDYTEDNNQITATLHCAVSQSMPHQTYLKIVAYASQPCFDIIWGIVDKPEDNIPEAGWLSLPLNIDKPEYRFSRTGSIINPATDFADSTIHNYYSVLNGFSVLSSDKSGISVYPEDANIISLNEPGLYKIPYKKFKSVNKDLFLNLYNNLWGVNFRLWIGGSWTSATRIWTFDHYNNETSLMTPSEEAKVPLHATIVDGKSGELPESAQGIGLSRKGIVITAFGKNPDGDGTILRLWETSGNDGKCTIRLPDSSGFKTVQLCDLRGTALGSELPLTQKKVTIDINHYSPVSMILK
jgi:alpha-mannosidase